MKTLLSVVLAIVGLVFMPMFIYGLVSILQLHFGFIQMFMLGFSTCIECCIISLIRALNK